LGSPLLFTGEFELAIMIEVVDRRDGWVGLRSRPATDWKRALVEYGTYSIRAKWRSLQSAQGSMLKKDLDTADIVRDGLLNEAALRQSCQCYNFAR
jgi:hypothetical protein